VHRWVGHTAEVELVVEAESEEAVFREALAALAELLGEAPRGAVRTVGVDLEAPDRAALLADWLAELVFLSETEGFLPTRARDLDLDGDRMHAVVEGRTGEPRFLVKAVTLHRLAFERANGGFRARVVLDV
jgi:protein archease